MHVMLDLETWGLYPGCDIRSIGAVVFDPVEVDINPKSFYMATENPVVGSYKHDPICERKYKLIRDPETVKWWNEQSEEAQAAFTNPIDLWRACFEFRYWLWRMSAPIERFENWEPSSEMRIWSKGPHFDIAILAAVYRAVRLPIPWHYRAPRDMRTILDAAGITRDQEKSMFSGVEHNSLDDAISQAKIVCVAYQALNLVQE